VAVVLDIHVLKRMAPGKATAGLDGIDSQMKHLYSENQ
jgi:hypothetical protein